jgi:hypothetical protein
LIGGEGMEVRVAIQIKDTRQTPSYDASDDVYYAEGSATLI